MIPPPRSRSYALVMQEDAFTLDALSQLNDIETEIVTYIERQFLKTLEGVVRHLLSFGNVIMKKRIPFIFRSFIFA
jgi:hypothetical protein